ncbi:MAG: DUF4837 family protein [Marinilabiliaceae bacterium]|nr:DUF4837 family protein [Marinilabiliaceae bacterium]
MLVKRLKYVLLIAVAVSYVSCKNEKDGYKPNVAGSAGEMLIVMDDKVKSSTGGQSIQYMMIQPYLGLPQEEPHFNISVVPHRSLTSSLKIFRNLVLVEISPNVKADTIKYYENMWARPQASARITATDTTAFRELIEQNEILLLSFFNKMERKRSQNYFKKYPNPDLMELWKKQWDARMTIPTGFLKNKGNENFAWMSEEAAWGTMGIMTYEFPYVGEGTFSKEYLLNKRDSMLNKNLPGPSKGSYMTTEHGYPVMYKRNKVNGLEAVELRGLWKVQNDMMGGPFLLRAHWDKARNRVLVTDGYVYCPEKPEKRDKIRQLEAIMYSLQVDSDPITEKK